MSRVREFRLFQRILNGLCVVENERTILAFNVLFLCGTSFKRQLSSFKRCSFISSSFATGTKFALESKLLVKFF